MTKQVEAFSSPITERSPSLSWIDRLILWIDRLPGPAWLFYIAAALVTALLINLSLWIDGVVPFFSYHTVLGINPPIVVAFLALYHYLTGVGKQSLETFRPLLDVSDAEFTHIEHEFSTLPNRFWWWILLVALLFAAPFLLGDPQSWGDLVPLTPLPLVVLFLIIGFFNITFFGVFLRSFRQIRMINQLHKQAANINLMKLEPAHAFSALTSRTGLGVFLIVLAGFLFNSSSALDTSWNIFTYSMTALLSIIIFIVPVIGIRRHLIEKKTDELYKMEDLLQVANGNLHEKINQGDFDNLGGIQTALNLLERERDRIKSVSTWPWNTGTIRGFASTLILPIFLRFVTQLISNFF
ncbi:MAG: hypothetical protein P8046_01645 [Anaerolineales bacterium]